MFNEIFKDAEKVEYIKRISGKFYFNSELVKEYEFDDFLQIVYIDIYKKINGFEEMKKTGLNTYLYRIINSCFLDELKKRNTIKRKNENISLSDELTNKIVVSNNFYELEEELIINEWINKMDNETDKLVLFYKYRGYSNTDIMKKINLSRRKFEASIKRIREVVQKMKV